MAYLPNRGKCPPETEIWADVDTDGVLARTLIGHRSVHVRLFGDPAKGKPGWDSKKAESNPWPAKGGRPVSTNWSISSPPHEFQIKEYEVL